MATAEVGISSIKFILTYGPVNPGQYTDGIDDAHFRLKFKSLTTLVQRVEKLTAATLALTMQGAGFVHTTAEGPLIPLSFTIITSRTSPDEPQPVIGAS